MQPKFLHSIHIPHYKNTEDSVPTRLPDPAFVAIPMSMHIGAPSLPIVKPGDHVKLGQKIAEAQGNVSSPVHASISGVVKSIDTIRMPSGLVTQSITIENDGLREIDENIFPPTITDFQSFIDAVRESGIVGLGGAGFPTHVKLNVAPERVEYFIVNGAECEPYITADTHTMVDNAKRILDGVEMLLRFYPKAKIIFGIENNKPEAIRMMKRYSDKFDRCRVFALPSTYPQGGERSLVYNTIHRVIPEGKLPIDVGCIVINATTLSFVGKYVRTGFPLTTKCVTVDGSAIKNPQNIIVPVGAPIRNIIDAIGGFTEEPKKILYGGPMMGMCSTSLDHPIIKGTNAILCFTEKDARIPEPTACIHCGRCADACSMHLLPMEMEQARISGDLERLKKLHVNLCMDCGSCAFSCPAKRNLVESHKLAKQMLREAAKK